MSWLVLVPMLSTSKVPKFKGANDPEHALFNLSCIG